VEHFLIGGLILDWGVLYFERFSNKAVIVRGDRPDIQMAALGTPTSCIVLTGGHSPIQYVSYEAGEEEVPLIQVEADTLSTAAALESLQEKALFDHPMKQEQFRELMSQHVDWDALYRSLGV
jgi:BioD-like phosphotransacetylase family protein